MALNLLGIAKMVTVSSQILKETYIKGIGLMEKQRATVNTIKLMDHFLREHGRRTSKMVLASKY